MRSLSDGGTAVERPDGSVAFKTGRQPSARVAHRPRKLEPITVSIARRIYSRSGLPPTYPAVLGLNESHAPAARGHG